MTVCIKKAPKILKFNHHHHHQQQPQQKRIGLVLIISFWAWEDPLQNAIVSHVPSCVFFKKKNKERKIVLWWLTRNRLSVLPGGPIDRVWWKCAWVGQCRRDGWLPRRRCLWVYQFQNREIEKVRVLGCVCVCARKDEDEVEMKMDDRFDWSVWGVWREFF